MRKRKYSFVAVATLNGANAPQAVYNFLENLKNGVSTDDAQEYILAKKLESNLQKVFLGNSISEGFSILTIFLKAKDVSKAAVMVDEFTTIVGGASRRIIYDLRQFRKVGLSRGCRLF